MWNPFGWFRGRAAEVIPPAHTAQPASEKVPELDREVIPVERRKEIEGSSTPTYLVHDDVLREAVVRLYGMEMEIPYGDNNERDLVVDLYEGFRTGDFPKLTQVDQYLAARTFEELSTLLHPALTGKQIVMGEIDPNNLKSARNMGDFVRILTLDYPGHQDLIGIFNTTGLVGVDLSGQVIDQEAINALMTPRMTSIGGETDRRSRFDLLQITTDAFIAMGEPLSFGRLKFLSPYVPGIAACPEDRRAAIIEKLLYGRYPFNLDNQAAWHAEIGSNMTTGGFSS